MYSTEDSGASKIERLVPNGHKDGGSLSLKSNNGCGKQRKLLPFIFTHEVKVVKECFLGGGRLDVAL